MPNGTNGRRAVDERFRGLRDDAAVPEPTSNRKARVTWLGRGRDAVALRSRFAVADRSAGRG
jgi:hypothetical protein